jgi:hypothetical protein
MDAQEVIRQTKEVLKIGELRKTINNNRFLFYPKLNLYRQIVQLDKNKLSVCNQGGGFVKSIDITDEGFLKDIDNGDIVFKLTMPFEFKKVKLFHDHWLGDNEINDERELNHTIEGYVTIRKWNGWSLPYVELDQIKKFNEIQKLTDYYFDHSTFKIINDNKISIIDFNDREEIIIERELINVDGKTKKVFDISLGWTWSEVFDA